jgi:hypothetical protein
LWVQVSQDASKSLGLFNAHWFTRLLDTQGPMNGERGTIVSDPAQSASNTAVTSLDRSSAIVEWGEAIDVPILYRRETELATLELWILIDRCWVVALLGLGGIGKTSLAGVCQTTAQMGCSACRSSARRCYASCTVISSKYSRRRT